MPEEIENELPPEDDSGLRLKRDNRGGRRDGAGRPPKTEADFKRRKKIGDRLASLMCNGLEKRLIMSRGEKWKMDDDERAEITDAGGDLITELIEKDSAALRLAIAGGAYWAARAEPPSAASVWEKTKGWWNDARGAAKKDDASATPDSAHASIPPTP